MPQHRRSQAPSDHQAAIREAFKAADQQGDGDGVISFCELSALFRVLDGDNWTDKELETLFDTVDRNGDGFIRYDEFLDWLEGQWEEGGKEAAQQMAALMKEQQQQDALAQKFPKRWPVQAKLICARHSKPLWWDPAKHTKGEVRDPQLSKEGEAMANQLATRLLREEQAGFDVVICSPLARVLGTLAPLVSTRRAVKKAICHALLCEHGSDPRDFSQEALAKDWPSLFGAAANHEVAFAGFGQQAVDPTDTAARALAVAEWSHGQSKHWPQGAVIGIYAHQTILDCVLCILMRGSAESWEYGDPTFKIDKAAFSEIRISENGPRIVRFNENSHLR